jgi:hypothetical protein
MFIGIFFKINLFRIFFASILLSLKFNEDDFYDNLFYSKVGGISLQELNALEYEFIKLIRYNLFVDRDLYDKYRCHLNNYVKLEK